MALKKEVENNVEVRTGGGYYDFPHTRTYDSDLGFLIDKYVKLAEKYDILKEYYKNINDNLNSIVETTTKEEFDKLVASGYIDTLAKKIITETILYQLQSNVLKNSKNIEDILLDIKNLEDYNSIQDNKIAYNFSRLSIVDILQNKVDSLSAQLAGLIIESGNPNAEVSQARTNKNGTGFTTLQGRLLFTEQQVPMWKTGGSNIDANNLIECGHYIIESFSANQPTGVGSGFMLVNTLDNNISNNQPPTFIIQSFYGLSTPTYCFRVGQYNGKIYTFRDWVNSQSSGSKIIGGGDYDYKLSNLSEEGFYYVDTTNFTDMPEELPLGSGALVWNKLYYNMTLQILYDDHPRFIAKPFYRTIKDGTAKEWSNLDVVTNHKPWKQMGDFNEFTEVGNYLLARQGNQDIFINAPTTPLNTSILSVEYVYIAKNGYGAIKQTVTDLTTGKIFFRTVTGINGSYDFTYQKWNEIALTGGSIELGEKIVVLGDSIVGNTPTLVSDMMASILGSTVYNCAFGGARATAREDVFNGCSLVTLATQIVNNDYTLLKTLVDDESALAYFEAHYNTLKSIDFKTIDKIVLFFGTNDFASNIAKKDVIEAIKTSIQKIGNKFPNIMFYICTPIYRTFSNVSSDVFKNSNDEYLFDYIVEADFNKSIKVINCYNLSFNEYNRSTFYEDETHLNDKGKKVLARRISLEI